MGGEIVLRISSTEPSGSRATTASGRYEFLSEAGDISQIPQGLLMHSEAERRAAISAADASIIARVAVHGGYSRVAGRRGHSPRGLVV